MSLEVAAYIGIAFLAGNLLGAFTMALMAVGRRQDQCAHCMFTHATQYPVYDHIDSSEVEVPQNDELPF